MSSAVISPSEQAILNELELTTSSTTTLEPSPKYSPPVLSTPGSVDVELLNKQLTKIQTSITDGTAQIMAKLSSMNMKGGAFNPNTVSRMKGGGLFDGLFGATSTAPSANSGSGSGAPVAPVAKPGMSRMNSLAPRPRANSGTPRANSGMSRANSGPPRAVSAPRTMAANTGTLQNRNSGAPKPSLLNTLKGLNSAVTGGYRGRGTRKSRRSGKKSRRSSRK